MYELLYSPLPDMENYLKRIGAGFSPGVDKISLDRLIYSHQCSVPFENMDPYLYRKPVSLEIPALYQKIVEEHRGGYCFELNGLFACLLTALGYEVLPCMARILLGEKEHPPISHRCNLVPLDGELYFCDVGFGGPMPGGGLLLRHGYEQSFHGQKFNIRQENPYWWTVLYLSHGSWMPVLSFSVSPCEPVDFVVLNQYAGESLESLFVRQPYVNLKTENGNLGIMGNLFTRNENGIKTETILPDQAALLETLDLYFHVKLPNGKGKGDDRL